LLCIELPSYKNS